MNPAKYEIASPQTEQEVPPDHFTQKSATSILPDADEIERDTRVKKAEQEIHLKDNAFVLLCGCLIACAVLYLIDTGVVVLAKTHSSETLTTILDLAKTVITFLLGYLFAYENPKK